MDYIPNLNSDLISAAGDGDLDRVKLLHAKGADITANDNEAVRGACYYGHLETVKYLHAHGADLTVKCNLVLTFAAASGYIEVIRYLQLNGVNLRIHGICALRLAVYNGRLEVARFLHNHGADICNLNATEIHGSLMNFYKAQLWLAKNVSPLRRLAAKIYIAHYHNLPDRDTIPSDVMDILVATQT